MLLYKYLYITVLSVFLGITYLYGDQSVNAQKQNTNPSSNDNLKMSFEVLNEKINKYRTINLDSALYFADALLQKATKETDTFYMAASYFQKGFIYAYTNEDSLAIKSYNTSIHLLEYRKDAYYLHRNYANLGHLTSENGDWDKALQYYNKAIEYAEDKKQEIDVLISIANAYYYVGEGSKTKALFEEILNFYKDKPLQSLDSEDKARLLVINNNYADFVDDLKERIFYRRVAVRIAESDSLLHFYIPKLYSGIGYVYHHFKQKDSTLFYYKKALDLAKETHSKSEKAYAYYKLCYYGLSFNEPQLALNYLDSLHIRINDKNQALYNNKNLDSISYEVYKLNKDYKSALQYAESYIAYQNNKIHNIREKTVLESAKKYETDKKIEENNLLKKDAQIKALELSQQKRSRNFFIILSIGIFCFFVVIIFMFLQKRKTANLLDFKNKTITKQNQLLEEANKAKQKFFSIIGHDLINPFNTILGYTSLLDSDYDALTDEEKKNFINVINQSSVSNYTLTKNLLEWAKSQQDGFKVLKSYHNSNTLLTEALAPYKMLAKKKAIAIYNKISDDLMLYVDKNMILTVFGNIINNCLKFSNPESTIIVQATTNAAGITTVSFENEYIKSNGSATKSGSGLGLKICKDLMHVQDGKFSFEILNGTGRAISSVEVGE